MGCNVSSRRTRDSRVETVREHNPADSIAPSADGDDGFPQHNWEQRLRKAAAGRRPNRVLLIGDFGKDLDDEKALVVAAGLRRCGLIGQIAVIANLGNSAMRARLAKGTLLELGHEDVPVAVGSDGGCTVSEHDYEFDCDYLAPVSSLHPQPGTELFFSQLSEAKAQGEQVNVVLCSSLKDMVEIMADARWEDLRSAIATVCVMGGAKEAAASADSAAHLVIDDSAQNFAFHLPAAREAFSRLRQTFGDSFVVVSRYAAARGQLPRRALDRAAKHRVAQRLLRTSKPSIQTLWQRVHRTQEERVAASDPLPARCDPEWFRGLFLEEGAAELKETDDVWSHVRGFNEYDGMTLLVSALHGYPELFGELFVPFQCKQTGMVVVGLSPLNHGVRNAFEVAQMLHDTMLLGFGID
eukprot:TRINITY_DN2063_c0_g1_i3.p1 TRINITY_DN2063_c0_g1~~TRINITY_DN2063_c0_g1_i3.p1  ORF type:complete len:411 (+),score=80.81 TRINITY_DN2063_c0_g1_i3:87-1319(+)